MLPVAVFTVAVVLPVAFVVATTVVLPVNIIIVSAAVVLPVIVVAIKDALLGIVNVSAGGRSLHCPYCATG